MIKIEEHKQPQHNLASEKYLTPKKLYLPLSQHTGAPSLSCVQKGDMVEEGDLIAKEAGFISCRLHAPAKGKVLNIDNWPHPNLKKTQTIILQCEPSSRQYNPRPNIEFLKKEDLLEIIKDKGVVGLGGAAFPTQVKLNPPKKIDTLIINGCECEPYLAADYRLMMENLEEIFQGIKIICRLINPKQVFFAIEGNKPEAIKRVNSYLDSRLSLSRVNPRGGNDSGGVSRFRALIPSRAQVDTNGNDAGCVENALPNIKCVTLKPAYPQGGEKQLIYTITKRKVPGGKLPLDVGCIVHNVATCFSIYEAVYFNKPLIERLVSFCGDALVSPKNIWLKIGTTLKELFEEKILEFKVTPKKIICGGPMMGLALNNLDYPILKGNGGFLFLQNDLADIEESPCIKCGRCIDTCPMNLLPLEYVRQVKKEEYNNLNELNLKDCVECGCCAYGCPAKIPIVHYIKVGKKYSH
ncbi:MAG: RnfABCDGE type electron transport complex subunit C [Candidatus Omnitrophota bacterium]